MSAPGPVPQSLAGLREITLDWLAGRAPRTPWCLGPCDVDQAPGLHGALVALNRAGVFTDDSQEGHDGPGFDGARWTQVACVQGMCAPRVAAVLVEAAEAAGFAGAVMGPDFELAVTWREGEECTWARGATASERAEELVPELYGPPASLVIEIAGAAQLVLWDPEPGRNTLWAWLGDVAVPLAREAGRLALAWRGLPASGKTVAARALQAELREQGRAGVLCGRDHVRALLGLDPAATSAADERVVTEVQAGLIRAAIAAGAVALVDDTNLVDEHLAAVVAVAQAAGATVEVRDLRAVPVAVCAERDGARTGTARVGAVRIRAMATAAGLAAIDPTH